MTAFDINGREIKKNDLVKIVKKPSVTHGWLKVGNTLRVDSWDDRSMTHDKNMVVFLKSKKGGKLCSIGVQDARLLVIDE